MAEDPADTVAATATTKKKSKLPLVLGLVLFAVGAAGGFVAMRKGLVPGMGGLAPAHADAQAFPALPDIAFVPVERLVINLGDSGSARYLRFQAQIEVNGAHADDVTRLLPRIVDVLNGYLRAVDLRDIEDRSALVRLRAQMLRRIQLVAGAGRVRDLLITEFVVN